MDDGLSVEVLASCQHFRREGLGLQFLLGGTDDGTEISSLSSTQDQVLLLCSELPHGTDNSQHR